MNARHKGSRAKDADVTIVETLIHLFWKVMPRCSDGIHESPFSMPVIVIRVRKDRCRSSFASLLNTIMAEVELGLIELLHNLVCHLVITPTAIKADNTLFMSQLGSIDERHNTGTTDVFLICLKTLGE